MKKEFYQGWAACASFVAGYSEAVVEYAAKEPGITIDDLKKAKIDEHDMETLEPIFGPQ